MKKLVLALMVIGIAIPAMALDISLVDNGGGSATIQYTASATEFVRGVAIIVTSDVPITAVSGINPQFNTYMDAASEDPANYIIGVTGTPIADPAAVGQLPLPALSISLSLGVLDQSGSQAAASSNGTYNLATIETCQAATITIEEDPLRGGIVGDSTLIIEGVVNVSYSGGTISGTCGCNGDSDGSGNISIADLVDITSFLHPVYSTTTPKYTCVGIPSPGDAAKDVNGDGNISIADLVEITGFLHPAYSTTTPLYTGPAGTCVP
jgi:hypothetical protein